MQKVEQTQSPVARSVRTLTTRMVLFAVPTLRGFLGCSLCSVNSLCNLLPILLLSPRDIGQALFSTYGTQLSTTNYQPSAFVSTTAESIVQMNPRLQGEIARRLVRHSKRIPASGGVCTALYT